MRAAFAAIVMATLASCASPEDRDGEWRKTFVGYVLLLNDQPVTPSFRITFYSTDEDEAPERYRIESECFDVGYFDEDRRAFMSGGSPNGYGADRMSAKYRQEMGDGNRSRCPSSVPADFNRLLDLMYEGATLQIDGDKGRLTSPSGLSADLHRTPEPILFD